MADHVEFLKKVTKAKKHRQEYEYAGNDICWWIVIFAVIGTALLSHIPEYPFLPYIFSLIGLMSALYSFFKKERNVKKFKENFPEETTLLKEYDEIMK